MKKPSIVVVGSLNMDIVVEMDRTPITGETVLGNRLHMIPGGKGANQAVGAARLGAKTAIIGALGEDSFGDQLLKALDVNEVEHQGVKVVPDPAHTGVATIWISNADNSIVVVPGANQSLLPCDIERHESLIAEADIVLLQLEIPLETVEYAVRVAKRFGKKVILNPAPAQKLPAQLLSQVDVLTPNYSELVTITGSQVNGEEIDLSLLQQLMRQLRDQGVQQVITTLGARGAAFLDGADGVNVIPAFPMQVVDTTGAGDAFNAGLAFAMALGKSTEESIIFASRVSALSVTRLGAQASMPSWSEVEHHEQTMK